MNSLKILVSSWESLYPGKNKYDDIKSNLPIHDLLEETGDIGPLPLQNQADEENSTNDGTFATLAEQERLDRELRTSIDQDHTSNKPVVYDDDEGLESIDGDVQGSNSLLSTL